MSQIKVRLTQYHSKRKISIFFKIARYMKIFFMINLKNTNLNLILHSNQKLLRKNLMILSNLITVKVGLVAGICVGLGICFLKKKIMEKQDENKENESTFSEK